ncbi:hypothetical protein SAMN05443634_101123 [Chishuiella changwenlii]|uniref:Uncharacterized protein n=1 Tax=Chishuiella changwenlii TaxID=1434701 RepID=A0A1M6STY1_9FLAO|nr:hypothetical protein [Chishuiella changwenlii]GGF09271.1 hypothetical protein GCM10010984_28030 [Chishuiella changwenlii]SHK48184.1 hypothetical protein SAMN05443634_101123 [Chishuiella changwenlii]
MKITITFFAFLLTTISSYAQEDIELLTYANTQDINFFNKIKNGSQVKEYITVSENSVEVGDTLILGTPTSEEMSTRTYSGSYGTKARAGVAQSRSTSKKTYEFVKMGRPAGFGSVMTAMNGDAQAMADNSLKNTSVIVREIKTYHRGSKNKPLYVVMVLGEINGRAFGVNKYLSVMDTELAIESGEVLLKNRKITRDEAIAKLKEAKELMEIDMMSKEEFEELKKELTPIINVKKQE